MASGPQWLEETLAAWTYTREGVVAEFENIPADRFGFRPAPQSRTAAELARHIIEAGLMAAGELSRPDGDFTRQSNAAFIKEYAATRARITGKEALVALLRETFAESSARLRAAGEPLMLSPIRQFNGTPAPRIIWLHHAIGHEEYHRGQAALYARLLGLTPALTRLIHGNS
jgi:uncharacterized damage-inducible protein DinB